MSRIERGNVIYTFGWGTRGPLDPPPGGGDDGGMEARIARLETLAESSDKRLSLIEQDLRRVLDKLEDTNKSISSLKDSGFRAFVALLIGGAVLAYGVYREAPGKSTATPTVVAPQPAASGAAK